MQIWEHAIDDISENYGDAPSICKFQYFTIEPWLLIYDHPDKHNPSHQPVGPRTEMTVYFPPVGISVMTVTAETGFNR